MQSAGNIEKSCSDSVPIWQKNELQKCIDSYLDYLGFTYFNEVLLKNKNEQMY